MANKIDIRIGAKDETGKAWKQVDKRAKKGSRSLGKSLKKVGGYAKIAAGAIIAVGTAFLVAAYKAQQFNKQIGQIRTLTEMSGRKIKASVRSMSAEFGLAKEELTKGLYDALSAGVPKDNVFDFMRTASKMAIGGAATTAEAVDILTTAVNAFKIPAEQASAISDQLFTTVRLGKTTIAELGQSFSQVAPLAASSGVEIEQLLAAVATLTKQGTPTAQAMTQIRGAIIAMNRELGDGWSKSLTLQQGMQAMADKAGGSAVKLKKLTGRVEGMFAILATTGRNAKGAADDLEELGDSAGAAGEAFEKMKDMNPFDRLKQSLDNMVTSLGDTILESDEFISLVDDLIGKLEELQDGGYIEQWAADAKAAIRELSPVVSAIGDLFDNIKKGVQHVGGGIGARKGEKQEREADRAGDTAFKISDAQRETNRARRAAEDAEAEKRGVKINRKTTDPNYDPSKLTNDQVYEIASTVGSKIADDKEGERADRVKAGKESDDAQSLKSENIKRWDAADKKTTDQMQAWRDAATDKAADKEKAGARFDLDLSAIIDDAVKENAQTDKNKIALKDVINQQDVIAADADIRKKQAAMVAGDKNIENLQKEVEGVAMNKEQRRAQELEKRSKTDDDKRARRISEKLGRNIKLSKDDEAFMERRGLQKKLTAAEKKRVQDKIDLDKAVIDKAQDARDLTNTKLEAQNVLLTANLKGA